MAKKETQYTTVTMDDGRIVDFAGKRRMVKEVLHNTHGVQVRMDFVNGESRIFTVPHNLKDQCAGHGASQKLGDEIAGLEDVEDAVLAIDDLMERLMAGEWAVRREASAIAGTSVLARALVEATGKAPSAIKEFLASKSQAEKVALRQNPKIAPIVQRLEAEKNSKKSSVDTDSLLEELA